MFLICYVLLNMYYLFLQALKFFDQEFRPKTCTCGLVVAFNTKLALQCVKEVFGAEGTEGVTEEAVRSFIKSNGIGCTGKQVKFRMMTVGQQLRAVHVKREWFDAEIIAKLDQRKLCVPNVLCNFALSICH